MVNDYRTANLVFIVYREERRSSRTRPHLSTLLFPGLLLA